MFGIQMANKYITIKHLLIPERALVSTLACPIYDKEAIPNEVKIIAPSGNKHAKEATTTNHVSSQTSRTK